MITYSLINEFIGLMLMISLVACEKSNEDQQIKDQITGTWRSTNSYHRSYTFNEDNTFIDSLFTFTNNTYNVREIISGNYFINNGELTFSNINLVYVKGQDDPHFVQFSDTYNPNFVISFRADELVLNQKDVFAPVSSSNNNLLGKWYHNKLVAVYDSYLENKFTGGVIKGVYDFKSDLTVDWQHQISYDNTNGNIQHWSVPYEVTDSKLNINQWGIYNAEISFTKSNMIWLYADMTFKREK